MSDEGVLIEPIPSCLRTRGSCLRVVEGVSQSGFEFYTRAATLFSIIAMLVHGVLHYQFLDHIHQHNNQQVFNPFQ
ncbi:hypothetical protein PIB30_050324, partial [Stylosanthes scabra]|nr:hypothetical protein [Stylosanthes scabra]